MAAVISLINMKGGVGKTTLAAQLALYASSRGIRTLAIDLDPQANLSQTLLGQEGYLRFLTSVPDRPTINDVVRGYLPPVGRRKSPKRIPLQAGILKPDVWRSTAADLLPSRLELALTMKRGGVAPDILAREIAEIDDPYELIVIDCPPTESILTDAAYLASSHLLIPVRPEYLATVGLPLLARSVADFKRSNKAHGPSIAGVVINHSGYSPERQSEVQRSIREIREHAQHQAWHLFEDEIPYSSSWAKAARLGTPISQTPHARSRTRFPFQMFAASCLHRIGVEFP